MATNSSNTTATGEVGWQPAPLTRGTASILWNCTSVILLITWTSFHSSVGITRTQRVITTITAILVPELSALVAIRDMLYAYRLRYCFKYRVRRPGWKDGWTLTKSFLVVKGGIRAIPHHRRLSADSGSAQSVAMTAGKIIDTETFLWLAVAGRIRYKDFPTTQEINDKSKADWFSKVATLVQLVWTIVNMVCRLKNNCAISVMEVMILDWVIFGLLAIMLWWKCPQNIQTSYTLPVKDHRMIARAPPSEHDEDPPTGALLDHITVTQNDIIYGSDDFLKFELGHSWGLMGIMTTMLFLVRFLFWGSYQWHSAQHKKAWIILTAFSTISEMVLFIADPHMRFDWGSRSIYYTYIQPLLLEPPRFRVENSKEGGKWLALAKGMGIYNPTDLKPWRCPLQEIWHDIDLKLVVVAVFALLVCQSGKLIIAFMAFKSAPSGIYDVPRAWILEVLVHVGG